MDHHKASSLEDVTVRIPHSFGSAASAAGFVERAVASAMDRMGLVGNPYVIFDRGRRKPCLLGFQDGQGAEEYKGLMPHGLVECWPVLDLDEDGEKWAIRGHVDDRTALRSVVAHLTDVGAVSSPTEVDVYPVEIRTSHTSGEWRPIDDDPDGDAVFELSDDGDGERWTMVVRIA